MGKRQSPKARTFQYHALDGTKLQIRLLKVRYSEQDNLRQYDMESFELGDAPPFKALSYTWGRPKPTFDILVNDKCINVRESLSLFLDAFQADDYLWIDQLCIDKSNVRERNEQVALMASIYSQCDSVIMWLGSVEDVPDAPIWFNSTQSLESLALLLQQNYFTRLWIVQEVLLAQHIDVLVSHPVVKTVWISWKDMCSIVVQFAGALRILDAPSPALALLREYGAKVDRDLGSIVSMFSHGSCQDSRDKVYGLMGLVEESERLIVDYRKSIHEVFLDVLQAFCTSYVKKRDSHSSKDPFQYPSTLEDYYTIMLLLSTRMGFPKNQLESLQEMLQAVWKPETLDSRLSSAPPHFSPVTATGFEPAKVCLGGSQGDTGYTLEVLYARKGDKAFLTRLKDSRDRWWYVCNGKKYEYYHPPLEKATTYKSRTWLEEHQDFCDGQMSWASQYL